MTEEQHERDRHDQASDQGEEASGPAEEPTEVDWITISLALLAILALGGLVPLYLWVYFLYFP